MSDDVRKDVQGIIARGAVWGQAIVSHAVR